MDLYTAHLMGRVEHKERMREAARIRLVKAASVSQPRWTVRQFRRLLKVTGNGMIAVGKRMMPAQQIDSYPAEPKHQHAG